jgi:uncharacterized protein YndB with AHSA1/START domain
MESAYRHGIDEVDFWGRDKIEQTTLYRAHQSILDLPRGGGYWLWKPFIIKEALNEINNGDIIIYSDAGIEIIDDVSPLLKLCLKKEFLLFDGHYDDRGAPGPNICGRWTKRDCFVFMECDEPRYYKSRMLDASFLVLVKTEKTVAFIGEWLHFCSQPNLLTDEPNIYGHPNLPDFIEHRHDQSILSLLAARYKIELFRHPSQFGNYLKTEPYRQPGEWKNRPYAENGIYDNSPYKTILNHHRGNLGRRDILLLSIRRTISAPPEKVYDVWTNPAELKKWMRPAGHQIIKSESDLIQGGRYHFTLMHLEGQRVYDPEGEYLEVDPPRRLIFTWSESTRVTVEFHERGGDTEVVLTHEFFPHEKTRYFHLIGWNESLDRLAETILGSI